MTQPPKLIGLCGYARSGKDTVAAILAEHGYARAAWADKLREALLALNPQIFVPYIGAMWPLNFVIERFGWEGAKDKAPMVRDLLQRLGTDVGRVFFGDDIWIRLAVDAIQGPTVFTDCRFPNEAEKIRELGGEIWRVTRPGFGPVNNHASETALDALIADRVIHNRDSIDDLALTVRTALHRVERWHE